MSSWLLPKKKYETFDKVVRELRASMEQRPLKMLFYSCTHELFKYLTLEDFENLASAFPLLRLKTFCKTSREFYCFRMWVSKYIFTHNKLIKSNRLWIEIDFLTKQLIHGKKEMHEFKAHINRRRWFWNSDMRRRIVPFDKVKFRNDYNELKTLAFYEEVYWISYYTNTLISTNKKNLKNFNKVHGPIIDKMREKYLTCDMSWDEIVNEELQKNISMKK